MKALIDRHNKARILDQGMDSRKAWFDKLTTLSKVEAQSTPSSQGRVNYLGTNIDRYSPIFAALAPLREIFRVLVAALPREVLRGGYIHRIKYQQRETLY